MKILLSILLVLLLASCSASTEPSEASSDLERELSVGFESSSSASESEKSNLSFSDESSSSSQQSESEKSSLGSSSESSSVSKPSESSFEPQFDLNEFTKNYYVDISYIESDKFYQDNADWLNGYKIDFSTATREYNCKYHALRTPTDFDAFIDDYNNSGKIWDMYEERLTYGGPCYRALIVKDLGKGSFEKNTADIEFQNGEYKVRGFYGNCDILFPSNKKLLSRISEIYDLDKMQARFVGLSSLLDGILLSDGTTNEYFIVTSSLYGLSDIFKEGSMYSVKNIVETFKEHKSIIASSEENIEFEVNEDGEIDVVVG